jgi:excinuclease UvrABC nuclease subunit
MEFIPPPQPTHKYIHTCTECKQDFETNLVQTKRCSEKCVKAYQKRYFNENKKVKEPVVNERNRASKELQAQQEMAQRNNYWLTRPMAK